jgi:Ca-activated chloride channel family protein
MTLATWGALALAAYDPIEVDVQPSPRASRQLLIVLDVSPSMNLKDSGPGLEKVTRGQWAGKVVQGILDRLDMKDTRVSMVVFYSKALPLLQDTTDKNVVSNVMSGLPLYVAFAPGETDLQSGIDEAFKMAKGWARDSTTLVIMSDGDLKSPPSLRKPPPSIADTIVIGVGDPVKPTLIAGHSSKQNTWALKQLAASLGGYYHEGNTRHLPTEIVESLTMISPRVSQVLGLREAGLITLGVGSAMVSLIGPALLVAGVPGSFRRTRAAAAARRSGTPTSPKVTPSRTTPTITALGRIAT